MWLGRGSDVFRNMDKSGRSEGKDASGRSTLCNAGCGVLGSNFPNSANCLQLCGAVSIVSGTCRPKIHKPL